MSSSWSRGTPGLAAGDATRALRDWEQATDEDRAPAYFAYQAALDREQQAAAVLAEIAAERRPTTVPFAPCPRRCSS